MKKLLAILFIFWCYTSFAQAPQSFNYQAVARDNTGNPLANKAVSFRISVLDNGINGSIQYQEVHNPTTNQFGLVTLEIGKGTISQGNFSAVTWANGNKFLRIELDASGGSNYIVIGSQQLLSVPYALYAEKSGNSGSSGTTYTAGTGIAINNNVVSNTGDVSNTNEIQTLSLSGNTLNLSNNGGSVVLPTSTGSGTTYSAGTGIAINNNVITNTLPDQAISLIGTGGTSIIGTYPNFTINSTLGSGTSQWTTSNNNIINNNTGKVFVGQSAIGIGRFSIYNSSTNNGDIPFESQIANNSSYSLNSRFSRVISGQGYALDLHIDDNGGARFFTNSNKNLLFDLGSGNVGVGTTSPNNKLEVAGIISSTSGGFKFPDGTTQTTAATTGSNTTTSQWTTSGSNIFNNNSGKVFVGQQVGIAKFNVIHSSTNNGDIPFESQIINNSSYSLNSRFSRFVAGQGYFLDLHIDNDGSARLFTNSNRNLLFDLGSGNVGIGTLSPKSKVQVSNGDIYIESASNGVIMKSANGQCWRMTVSNTGQPIFTLITCP